MRRHEWRAVVGPILRASGVAPRVEIREEGRSPAFIEALFWERGKTVCLTLVKNYAYQADMFGQGKIQGKQGKQGKPQEVQIEVTIGEPTLNLRNIRTGKVFGSVRKFRDRFKPWEANLYLFERR